MSKFAEQVFEAKKDNIRVAAAFYRQYGRMPKELNPAVAAGVKEMERRGTTATISRQDIEAWER